MNTRDQRNWIIAAVFGVVFWVMATVIATAQHVPSLTVEGDRVTIDADFAWHHPDLAGVEIIQGVPLQHPSVVASSDGASPIVLKMPPGSHEITTLGFPADRMNPDRGQQTLTAIVSAPTRQQQINELYATYLGTRDRIIAIAPTTAEVLKALISYAGGDE